MAQVITLAGEKLFATKAQANQQLDIDTFIFANVAGQDPAAAIDRNEGIPTNAIVHQQNVQQTGRINDNVVVYSTVLDSVTGPFEFNWVGLYSSVNQTLVAISHVPTVSKTITAPGSAGNTLNRNFGIEYSGIADLAGISVSPETWQLDFSARLSGMDELTRQLASDINGKDWFIDDGFKVVPRSTANAFSVTPGVGYVSGLRVELKQAHILTLQTYPQFVYVDAYFDGNASSQWKPKVAFTVTSGEMDDYIDVNGVQHYVYKVALIGALDTAKDLRSKNGLIEKINNVSREVPESVVNNRFYRKGERIKINQNVYTFILDVQTDVTIIKDELLRLINKGDISIASVSRKLAGKFNYPNTWQGFAPDIHFSKDGYFLFEKTDSEFRKKYSVKADHIKANGNKTYYVTTDGDDITGNGLSEGTAFRSINKALSQEDVLQVLVRGSAKDSAGYVMSHAFEKSVNIISYGGRAVVFSDRGGVFVEQAAENVWKMNDSSTHGKPSSIIFKDEYGLPVGYTKVNSVNDVSKTPLSYWNDGNSLYVHSQHEPVVGKDLYATLKSFGNSIFSTAANSQNVKVYCEGLIWPNGLRSLANSGGELLVCLNCAAVSTDDQVSLNGWTISGHNSIFHKCIAAYTELDGFNYTDGNQIESQCKAYSVGMKGIGSNQASTSHGHANTLRINCEYEGANQNAVLDVGSGETINLSVKTTTSNEVSNCFQTNNQRDMWCIDCSPSGVVLGTHYDNAGTGKMYIDSDINGVKVGGEGKIILSEL